MKMIVGLGNPGTEYDKTRHNIGFMMVDKLAEHYGVTRWRAKYEALYAEVNIEGCKTLLVKPQTYMNCSGEAVAPLFRWHKLAGSDLIVIYDDMDLPPGSGRIRKKGSAGGHNGIKSIIAALASEDFIRLRVGIGRPQTGRTTVDHVLTRFTGSDGEEITVFMKKLISVCECLVLQGADTAMQRFVLKKKSEAVNEK